MEIRKSTPNDIDTILQIFTAARAYMAAHGNATQWDDNYPGKDILTHDIAQNVNYVLLDHGDIVGTFTFIIGDEPTYRIIENGTWRYHTPYGTIHRLASNGKASGIAKACFDFCTSHIGHIRIDTHRNNLAMRSAIEKYGFRPCEIVYVRNGAARIAYDYRI